MASSCAAIALHNGVLMPRVGLGTYRASGDDVVHAVEVALRSGIRHLDTAAIYKNEELVHEGLRRSQVPRSEVFITSKLSPYQQGTARARQGALDMVAKLGGEPVDLALIHWPGVSGTPLQSADNARLRLETWRVLEELYGQGVFRAIGVSNYEVHHLKELLAVARVPPMVNQIEVHPRRPATDVRQLCQAHGIVVTAYSPLGQGHLVGDATVGRAAAQVGCSPAQALLRWGLAKRCVVIPKSVQAARVEEFAAVHRQLLALDAGHAGGDGGGGAGGVWDVEAVVAGLLDPGSVAALDALEDGTKFCWDPSGVA